MDKKERQILIELVNKLGSKKELNYSELNMYLTARHLLGLQ